MPGTGPLWADGERPCGCSRRPQARAAEHQDAEAGAQRPLTKKPRPAAAHLGRHRIGSAFGVGADPNAAASSPRRGVGHCRPPDLQVPGAGAGLARKRLRQRCRSYGASRLRAALPRPHRAIGRRPAAGGSAQCSGGRIFRQPAHQDGRRRLLRLRAHLGSRARPGVLKGGTRGKGSGVHLPLECRQDGQRTPSTGAHRELPQLRGSLRGRAHDLPPRPGRGRRLAQSGPAGRHRAGGRYQEAGRPHLLGPRHGLHAGAPRWTTHVEHLGIALLGAR